MAKKKASKSTISSSSSWWKERGKIMASAKTVAKTAKPKAKKKVTAKKAKKAERGMAYVCDVCGCEVVCVSDSAGNVVCCEEPMSLIF
jgi:hypothetical protein